MAIPLLGYPEETLDFNELRYQCFKSKGFVVVWEKYEQGYLVLLGPNIERHCEELLQVIGVIEDHIQCKGW